MRKQSQRLLQLGLGYGPKGFTVKDIINELGYNSPRKVISDLRKYHTKIHSIYEHGKNRFGDNISWKRYWILGFNYYGNDYISYPWWYDYKLTGKDIDDLGKN